MNAHLPAVLTLSAESSTNSGYDNHPIARINNHVVRISTMSQPYPWHFHPNSDETFLVIEGRLCIEFESGSLELDPGQLVTIPRGVRHRTRPIGMQSVNLTFDLAAAGNRRSLTRTYTNCPARLAQEWFGCEEVFLSNIRPCPAAFRRRMAETYAQ